MRLWPLIGLIFLTGCDILGIHNGHNSGGGMPIFIIAGQSNSVYMIQYASTTFIDNSHASIILSCGVSQTPMNRWTADGDLYQNMADQAKAALIANPGSYIAGLVFWQGETDASWGEPNVSLWPARFRAMTEDFQKRFGPMPIAFAQVTDDGTPSRKALRDYQAGVCIKDVSMVSTDGIVHIGDHTDITGYEIMAERFARTLLAETN